MISCTWKLISGQIAELMSRNFRLEIEPRPVSDLYLQAIHVDGAPNVFPFCSHVNARRSRAANS